MIDYFIYIIGGILLGCGSLVIGLQNPIHSILFLVLVFFNGSLFLMILEVEFFAIIFLVIYVGAIVILFLFMVMMLRIKNINISQTLSEFFPYSGLVVVIVLIESIIYHTLDLPSIKDSTLWIYSFQQFTTILGLSDLGGNINVLGSALYTSYLLPFLEGGLLLFLSMVGAIVVALDPESKEVTKKYQDPINQVMRNNAHTFYFSLADSITYGNNIEKLVSKLYIKLLYHKQPISKVKFRIK